MNVVIRKATAKDLEAVWQMWRTIQGQKIYYPYQEDYPREAIEKSWINLHNDIYVADNTDEVVGAYILRPNQPGYGNHIANAAYMIKTEQRGVGIGRALCAHSIKTSKELGYQAMQFNFVVSTNKRAIQIWLKHGFKIIGTIPEGFWHFEKGYIDVYIFYRKL